MTSTERYRHLLQDHDWTYEMSDDGHYYRKGRAERAELERLRKELDPDYKIWNEVCPPSYKVNHGMEQSASPSA